MSPSPPLPGPGLLGRIRAAAAAVAGEARHVHLDPSRLDPVASSLAGVRPSPAMDAGGDWPGEGEQRVAFVLTWAAVNFGSGWFPVLQKLPGASGAVTVMTRLADHVRAHGPWAADRLATIGPAELAAVLGQDPTGPAAELLDRMATSLQELGTLVAARHEGRFGALVEAAGGSAEGLVALLDEAPSFHDVRAYHGRDVPFFKRAQLAAADLDRAFAGRGPGRFDDLDRLTLFADNLVPHVLRVDGLLVYDPDLVARIDAGEPIPAGSDEEVEIRAVAIHAVELLVARLRAAGRPARPMDLDLILWRRGQAPRYKAVPRHRTRTTSY